MRLVGNYYWCLVEGTSAFAWLLQMQNFMLDLCRGTLKAVNYKVNTQCATLSLKHEAVPK